MTEILITDCDMGPADLERENPGRGWPARGAIADQLELATCTLGLFGFGAIARAVARRAAAFGMRVLARDPYVGGEKSNCAYNGAGNLTG